MASKATKVKEGESPRHKNAVARVTSWLLQHINQLVFFVAGLLAAGTATYAWIVNHVTPSFGAMTPIAKQAAFSGVVAETDGFLVVVMPQSAETKDVWVNVTDSSRTVGIGFARGWLNAGSTITIPISRGSKWQLRNHLGGDPDPQITWIPIAPGLSSN